MDNSARRVGERLGLGPGPASRAALELRILALVGHPCQHVESVPPRRGAVAIVGTFSGQRQAFIVDVHHTTGSVAVGIDGSPRRDWTHADLVVSALGVVTVTNVITRNGHD